MNIRHATSEDLSAVMRIFDHARAYMRANHNPTQWTGGYPSEAIVREDLEAQRLYVCTDGPAILGTFCYFFGDDPTYRQLREGSWLNQMPYGVMHRVAVAVHRRGVASFCYAYCFSLCGNLKVDTHRDNLPMQRSLERNGFVRCGVICLPAGEERIAFQKTRASGNTARF